MRPMKGKAMITQTNKKATVSITLEYDLESLRFISGEEFPEEEFGERVKEYAEADLLNYLRSNDLEDWAEITIDKESK